MCQYVVTYVLGKITNEPVTFEVSARSKEEAEDAAYMRLQYLDTQRKKVTIKTIEVKNDNNS